MNMFKSRRKAREQSDAVEGLTNAPSPPATFRTVKSLKRRNKNIPEDPKPTFDLKTALPGEDDFRTSLLMSNLSARFSMLREQDDPNSKIGKASDDSVLFPRRASRLNLFTNNQLSDLAEVESVYSTFRPPFADRDRSGSIGDGYESDNGSVMNRSRPVEGGALFGGNTLFGGQQKFYKIPTASKSKVTDIGPFTTRKHLFEHDTSPSHFQQYRRKDQDDLVFADTQRGSVSAIEAEDCSEIASPATVFSKNRGTQSSTNSAPRRSSTAATSVASETAAFRNSGSTEDEVAIKSNNSSSLAPESHTATSVSKPREDAIPNRFASKRSQRPVPIYNSTSLRNASSPILPVTQPLDFGFKVESRSNSATGQHQANGATPSPGQETDNVLAHSMQPNDRGKATALGLFNKPAREFDEQQFSQRQLQMHEEQVSSMSNNSRSTSRASDNAQTPRNDSVSAITSPDHVSIDRDSTPRIPPIPSTPASPAPNSHRGSKASGRGTPPLRPRSKSSASTVAISNVKARIDSLIRKQNAELVALEAEKLGTPDLRQSEDLSENKENYTGAFFDNDDDSDADESNDINSSRANSSHVADESHIHPAFRSSYRVSETHSRKSNHSNFSRTRSIVDDDRRGSSKLQVPKIETDVTTQQNGLGLSGLIRTHLRQDSDRSSIFPRPDSGITLTTAEPSQRNSVTLAAKTTANSSRVDLSDISIDHPASTSHVSQAPLTPNTALSQVAQQFLSRAMAITDATEQDNAEDPVNTEEDPENASKDKPWREDLEPKHQRGGSSETTKERREFDQELAARRRKIREGLKSVTERDRSQSPATAVRGQSVIMQAFVQPGAATDPQLQGIQLPEVQNGSLSGPTDDDRGRNMDSRHQTPEHTPESTGGKRHIDAYARFDRDPSTDRPHQPRSATPPAIRQGRRDRSASNAGGRSKSRASPREQNPPIPNNRDYFANWEHSRSSPLVQAYKKSELSLSKRNGYQAPRATPPPEASTILISEPMTKPTPMSPTSPYSSVTDTHRSMGGPNPGGRTTPSSGRATPTNAFSRKKSVTKTMISEPTFVSSTSSVPLVHLPEAQQSASASPPPLPAMNPRRRGNTTGDTPILSPTSLAFMRSTPLEPVPASPVISDFGSELNGRKTPSPRKLRKANSDGGSMAVKARHQASAAELKYELGRSPAIPIFPNRSVTALGISTDGGMF